MMRLAIDATGTSESKWWVIGEQGAVTTVLKHCAQALGKQYVHLLLCKLKQAGINKPWWTSQTVTPHDQQCSLSTYLQIASENSLLRQMLVQQPGAVVDHLCRLSSWLAQYAVVARGCSDRQSCQSRRKHVRKSFLH